MRLSTTAIFFLIFILIFSIFVANFANIVNIDQKLFKKLNKNNESDSWMQKQKLLHLNNSTENLMWFIQISDIHISIFNEKSRIEQFKNFVENTIDIIKPSVVLASGDLTDARDSNIFGSRQYVEEWNIYSDILSGANITQKTEWLDVRGNHDYFNVPAIDSPLNYFKTHSIQGKTHPRSYLHQVKVGNEIYSFIAVDACLEPGPKRPYNFLGLLDTNELSSLIDLSEMARKQGGNYTIWFGHYPTSCILSSGIGPGGIREIIGNYDESYAYLCGHLHTQGGLVTKMYTLQKAGFLELELGDWKYNRLFRIAAFDHGLFSFIDIRYGQWPIVLITNPKNALFNIPNKENPLLQLKSTHIRILIFSPSKVIHCAVKIKNEEWKQCEQISENLFVVPWIPKNYVGGIHNLEVTIRTQDGRSSHIIHPFSLDESRLNFGLLARFVLMSDANKLFQAFFGITLSICIIPLCIMRIYHELVLANKCKRPRIKLNWWRKLIRKMWILSTVDRILIPLLFYFIYIAVGPWSFCEIIDGYYGVVFVWGIFVNNAFLPGTLSYIYGGFQLLFCQFPLIFIYADTVNMRFMQYCDIKKNYEHGKLINLFINMPFVVIMTIEIILALLFWWNYGSAAFILGLFRTWSVGFNIILWYCAYKLPKHCLSSAISVWHA